MIVPGEKDEFESSSPTSFFFLISEIKVNSRDIFWVKKHMRLLFLFIVLVIASSSSIAMTIPWAVEWDGRWRFCFNHTESVGGMEWTDPSVNATLLTWYDEHGQWISNITCNATACQWEDQVHECIIPRHEGVAYMIRFFVDHLDQEPSNISLSSNVRGSWISAHANVPARTLGRRHASRGETSNKVAETTTTTTSNTPSWLWAPLAGSAVAILALVAGLSARRYILLQRYHRQRAARELEVAQSIPEADIQSQSMRAQEELDETLDAFVRKRNV